MNSDNVLEAMEAFNKNIDVVRINLRIKSITIIRTSKRSPLEGRPGVEPKTHDHGRNNWRLTIVKYQIEAVRIYFLSTGFSLMKEPVLSGSESSDCES